VARSSLVALVLVLVPVLGGSSAGPTLLLIATAGTVAWLVARVSSTRSGFPIIAGAFVASATLQSGLAIWEAHTGHRLDLYGNAASNTFGPRYFYGYEGKDRPTGSFYDPISYANVVALALPLALVLAIRLRSYAARLGLLAAAVVCGIGLALSLSRMSWIGAVCGLALAVALLPRGPRAPAALALVASAALVAAVVLAAAPKALSLRFSSIQSPTTARTTGADDQQRLRLWGAAVSAAHRQPLFGTGVGGLTSELEAQVPGANHAHSTYLEVIGEMGLAGGLGLALLVGAGAGSALVGLRHDRVLAAGVCGAFLALLAIWTTDFTVRYVPVAASAAVVFGLAAALARRARETSCATAQRRG
jgi:O-antigen ligase